MAEAFTTGTTPNVGHVNTAEVLSKTARQHGAFPGDHRRAQPRGFPRRHEPIQDPVNE